MVTQPHSHNVKTVKSRLSFFYFSFDLFLCFLFIALGLGLEVISHTITSVTSDDVVTTLITELEKREVEGSRKSNVI